MRQVATCSLLALCAMAAADDGWISNGGAPKLMSGHPTVRMAREVVNIEVSRTRTVVDAHFWFHDDGDATTARVGFPDEVSDPTGKPALKEFQSWVAGRKVQTAFLTGPDGNWHVKTVAFPARSTIHVQNSYVIDTGVGRIGAAPRFASYAHYVLHTGASWKGSIGEVIVNIRFAPDVPAPHSVKERLQHELSELTPTEQDRVIARERHTVFATGPAKPKLRTRVLTFYRRNLEPDEKDDIGITFFLRQDPELEKRIQG